MPITSSILTNVAANTALMNLENTQTNLQKVQQQISTGLAVSSAADNASYFSIATVLRSDTSALGNVSNTLNEGDSSLSLASSALGQIQTTLGDIKNQLINATAPGANMTVIQQQISQDQQQLKSVASSANFNGQNFLSTDSSVAGYNATKSFVSSFSRDSTGNIAIGFISINTADTTLFDSGGTYTPTATGAITTSLTGATTSSSNVPTGIAGTTNLNEFTASTSDGNLQITSYSQDPSNTSNYYANTINIGNVSTTNGAPVVTETAGTAANGFGGLSASQIATGDTLGAVASGNFAGTAAPTYNAANHTLTFYALEHDSTTAGSYAYNQYQVSNFYPTVGNGYLDKTDTSTVGSYTDSNGNTTTWNSTGKAGGTGTGVSIMGINVSGLTDSASDLAQLNAYSQQVDAAISNTATSAATLGAAQSRIEAQSSFVSSLQTSLNDGVGTLVDADLNATSTRLQALQVQQQLAVQSLSIANQSSQQILKLFQ